jgi:hypothetical protein
LKIVAHGGGLGAEIVKEIKETYEAFLREGAGAAE